MNVKEEVAPNSLDVVRVAVEQLGDKVIVEQLDDGRPAGADGIAVTCSSDAVGVGYAHHRRLLALKALNRVGTLDLGRQIYLQDLNGNDFGHWHFPFQKHS